MGYGEPHILIRFDEFINKVSISIENPFQWTCYVNNDHVVKLIGIIKSYCLLLFSYCLSKIFLSIYLFVFSKKRVSSN